jgi:hypothetical protein
MKKLLQRLLLCAAMVGLLSVAGMKQAQAQVVLDTPNWEILADSVDWLSIAGNQTRGLAANPVTGNLIVATRAGGTAVKVISAEDGSVIRNMNIGAITGGYFPVNRVAVSEDGQIFVTNFSLNGPEHRIYWWADEEADAKMVWDGNPYGDRIGDGFGVTGSGDDIKVYVSGTFQSRMAEFTWNPSTQMLENMRLITLPNQDNANASIIQAPDNPDYLWINGRDAPIAKIDRNGNLIRTYGPEVVPQGNGELDIVELNGNRFMLTGVRAPGDNAFTIIDFTNEASPYVIAQTRDLTIHTNDFRVADVAFDAATSSASMLVTNSGIFNFTLDVDEIITDELIGSYYIPQGDFPRGFDSLKEAVDSVNAVGISGPVTFFITDDLDESAEMVVFDRSDLGESNPLTIRPAPGTAPVISVSNFRFVNTGHIIIEGSATGGSSRDLTLNMVSAGPMLSFVQDTDDITLRNVNLTYDEMFGFESYAILVNRWIGTGQPTGRSSNLRIENVQFGSEDKPFNDGIWLFGDANAAEGAVHVNTAVVGNEFFVGRSALRTQTHVNTTFNNNIVKLYPRVGAQGLNLNTPLEGFTARNNEFEFVGGNMESAAMHVAINVTNTLVAANIYNNTVAVNYDGAGTGHSFYAIRHGGTGTTGPLNFYHNSFRIGDTGQTGVHAVLGRAGDASTGLTLNFVNNILVSDRDADNSIAFEWAAGSLSSNWNNIYFPGDALVGKVGDDVYGTVQEWSAATSRDLRSVSAPVEFVSESNLRLTGESIGDIRLAGTPIAAVPTDIDGNARDEANPYMGASEGDIQLIPEPDIRPFTLLDPPDGASVDLGDVTENVVISWEFPQSTVAWAHMNGQFEDDQFAHAGNGQNGPGRYIGTRNDVEAWLQTPLLENPGTISFWASTYNNATVLDMVVELSADGEAWEELAVFEAREGGTGDINENWTYKEVDIDREGEFYVRFSQSGTVSGSFYLDDVLVTSATFDEIVVDEDFEDWTAFRSMRFTWHIDVSGSNFNNPALSLVSDRNGQAATLTLTANQVDAALAGLGIEEGATFSGEWTVTAELGETVVLADAPFGISLTRKIPTGSEIERAYEFSLNQNYPNPFNPATKIQFTLPETVDVRLDVYNIAGQRVATLVNEQREAGAHTVEFDGTRVASGVYIYRIQAGSFVQTRKMTLIK